MSFIQEIKNIIKWFTPYGIISHREVKLLNNQYRKEVEIQDYFLSFMTDDPEILEIIDYFKNTDFQFSLMNFPENIIRWKLKSFSIKQPI